ncbi:hypothetical protein [Streptococcus moroccensis]|uniref:Uncharacterized protein n=1 Tax=Streptococcus moroccensis TaxID=1451356 RepID=A0ABT9YQN7_9STRE|nr:hypothetical protein [Streptococcus moroccensis]MDQ0222310.1 hypothetical protein [Streptococcus moroccensis]
MLTEDFTYYTLTVSPDLALHVLTDGVYQAISYDDATFWSQVEAMLGQEDRTYISYRGGHVEKPLFVLLESLLSKAWPTEKVQEVLLRFLEAEGSPTKRLLDLVGEEDPEVYEHYLAWLNQPNLLDIETFDGRIYHNAFDRLEIQLGLPPAETTETYLCHLELIFQTEAFQTVFEEKRYLLETFEGDFHLPVNATTTDAQLTESFYTKGHLKDARSVFIPRPFLPFTYFLTGNLERLYQTYQERQPKEAIRRRFGKDGAITRFGDFVLSSGAGAPMGFEIRDYNPQQSWTSQVRVKRVKTAIRIDLTHIQANIMAHTVKDRHFKTRLALVQKLWKDQPERRSGLNRLLYPIQGAMDTPFDHDLHTPRYAYSMRMTHNLLLAGLLDALTRAGIRPLSLNNEVLFVEDQDLKVEVLTAYLDKLGVYYEYRPIDNLLIKDTNNYTYWDPRSQEQVFRGGSFNHHEGADVTTNMDTPPIVDWVLQQMIRDRGDFVESQILDYLQAFMEKAAPDQLKEFFMVPLYPIKNRWGLLYAKEDSQIITRAKACFATNHQAGWWYSQLYQPKSGVSDREAKDLVKQYQLPIEGPVKLVKQVTVRLDAIDKLTKDTINKTYYATLIANEIRLWRDEETI